MARKKLEVKDIEPIKEYDEDSIKYTIKEIFKLLDDIQHHIDVIEKNMSPLLDGINELSNSTKGGF